MARTRFTVKEGLSVADDTNAGGYPLIPTGTVMAYAGATAPDGWLLCNGAAVSRTTYANLWALVSSTYGSGDGTSTFNVPDMRSRMPIGAGSGTGLTSRTLAATGGTETVTIASGNLPTHQHTISHGHAHTIGATTGGQSVDHTHGITINGNNFDTGTVSADHSHSGTTSFGSADHTHNIPRGLIASAGTNRAVVSTNNDQATISVSTSGLVHTHTMTTGGISANHSHNANHGHTGSSVGASQTHSHAVTVSGGVTDNTTSSSGNGGFANTALGMMNPFLALNYIIKY
jgi:microcystin-dependent protein